MIRDTQRVKNAATATGATVVFDAGKLVKGRKRLVLTDTLGNVLASRVLLANVADGAATIAFWDEVAATYDLLGQVQVVFVESSFNGVFRAHLAQHYGIRVEKPVHVLVEKTNFCIHAWRWIVERTFAWLSANRRLSKEYDRSLRNANAWICLANIRRVLKFCYLKQLLSEVMGVGISHKPKINRGSLSQGAKEAIVKIEGITYCYAAS